MKRVICGGSTMQYWMSPRYSTDEIRNPVLFIYSYVCRKKGCKHWSTALTLLARASRCCAKFSESARDFASACRFDSSSLAKSPRHGRDA
eukprot:3774388-Pleurochrysis_carterae.AAC.2